MPRKGDGSCGGVTDLEGLKRRCTVTEDGHWLWNGSISKSGSSPRVRFQGVSSSARRLARTMAGIPINAGYLIIAGCDHDNCIAPEHSKQATMKTIVKRAKAKVPAAVLSHASQKGQAKRRRLTHEQVISIRADKRSKNVAAPEYGISPSMFTLVRAHKVYADVGVTGDVFALASSGMFTRLMARP